MEDRAQNYKINQIFQMVSDNILEHLQENVLYGTVYLGLGLALLSLIVAFIKSKRFRNK